MIVEQFNQARMSRCTELFRRIQNTSKPPTIRASESVEGLSLADMQNKYFAVTAGGESAEIALLDLLVLLQLFECDRAVRETRHLPSHFQAKTQITTEIEDSEAIRLLTTLLPIETPFDPHRVLRPGQE